jgi:putative ABC transport system permease protein
MSQMLYFIIGIILLALAFGIVNTMLMAVMERTRELGMLMAVGLHKAKIFGMIVLETILLSVQGAILGMALGWLTIRYLSQTGINLSQFSSGLSSFGIGEHLYPALDPNQYPLIAGLVLLTALLAAIYPAIKALSLKPAAAIREV